jgi:hypothetical protein
MIEKTKRKRQRVGPLPMPVLIGPELGAWQYHRAAALVVLLATLISLALSWGLVLLMLQTFFGFQLSVEIIVAFSVCSILLLQTWLFYRYCNVRVSANLFTYSYFLMTLVLVMMSGGYDSPLTIFLFCCVVITFRISEKVDGLMNAFFVLLGGAALTAMKVLGIEAPNLMLGLERPLLVCITWFITLVIFAASLATYHHQQKTGK